MLRASRGACAQDRVGRLFLVGILAMASLALAMVAKPPAAKANIPYPYQFMPYIDGYAASQSQSTCDPTAKPGVVEFRNLLNFWFGSHVSGIVRDCNIGGRSEHKEGRALDYHVNAESDPATTLKIIAWVLGSDEHGNAHAFGRRFGLMYIISNSRIFRFSNPGAGWQPYTPANQSTCVLGDSRKTACHIDHIHFSFSWAGARKQTSWWTTTQQTRRGCNSTLQTWTFATNGFGPLVQVKRISDAYGKVYDTQSEIRNSYWRVRAGGQQYFANQPLSLFANPRPQALLPVISGGWCVMNLT